MGSFACAEHAYSAQSADLAQHVIILVGALHHHLLEGHLVEIYLPVRDHQGTDPKIDLDGFPSKSLLVDLACHDLCQMIREELEVALDLVLVLETA